MMSSKALLGGQHPCARWWGAEEATTEAVGRLLEEGSRAPKSGQSSFFPPSPHPPFKKERQGLRSNVAYTRVKRETRAGFGGSSPLQLL